ncbi:hypothetical protein HDU97_003323 [Phlyctochytrium planicorne]|nr:hypothetical protein HDU97_003323 [Phlyctochytrium planicorne]
MQPQAIDKGDSPSAILALAESQLFLKAIPTAVASLIPLAEHLIVRLESHPATKSYDVVSATKALIIIWDHFLQGPSTNLKSDDPIPITRHTFHDADRIKALQSRIAIIARTLWESIHPPLDPSQPHPSVERNAANLVDDMAEKLAETRIKDLIVTARESYTYLVKKGPEFSEEKMAVAEQVVTYLQVGVNTIIQDLSTSLPKGPLGAARAVGVTRVRGYVTDTCADLQERIIDAIEDQSLRQRRKDVNRNVDAVIKVLEGQSELVERVSRDLKRLLGM